MLVIKLREAHGYPETYVYDCFGNLLYCVDGSCNVISGDPKYDEYEWVDYSYNSTMDTLIVII